MMRYAGILLLAATPAFAQAPKAIVERAISAHGGGEALAKTKTMVQVAQGRLNFQGVEVEASREGTWALPDRVRWSLELQNQGAKVRTTIVLDGLSGWLESTGKPASAIAPAAYDTIAEEAHVYWLCTVAPLLNKELTLAAATPATVDGQPCLGVMVSQPDKPDVTLYFSQGRGLLLKASFRGKESGTPCTKEFAFAEHKEFSNVKLPTRVTDSKDDVRLGSWTIKEYKFESKFPASTWKRP